MPHADYAALRDNLRRLRDLLPALEAEALGLALPAALETSQAPETAAGPETGAAPVSGAWLRRLVHNVLPALDFDLPVLLVAICGGGSTGKSTLLNSLAGTTLSRVGFRAGLTRRVLLAGHPEVLSGADLAQALLYRLGEPPVAWTSPDEAVRPGPPLYARVPSVPRHLLLIDTPDFDTGDGGRLVNRDLAEPILRTAEVLVYVFTNTVYNNLSNTRFMADLVGGIGGRPVVLVYRISREAPQEEVRAHCLHVGRRLFGLEQEGRDAHRDPLPAQVVAAYRMHESDAVVRGDAMPQLEPVLGAANQSLPEVLAGLDVATIKRHVFGADLAAIAAGAEETMARARSAAAAADLYRRALQQVMVQHALEALTAFPAGEAIALTARLFSETSPGYVRALRGTGRVISAPLRGARALGRWVSERAGWSEPVAPVEDLYTALTRDLLISANALRNRLLDDALIVRSSRDDPFTAEVRRAQDAGGAAVAERVNGGAYNLHIPAPGPVRVREAALLAEDWPAVTAHLGAAVPDLVGLPRGVEDELREQVREFRRRLPLRQRVREALLASLSALPPILGVTYTLLTANPVAAGGLWIQLESLFGLNDLWALVSIPAAAGLSEQERRQLEEMIAPVFRVWLERRAQRIVGLYAQTVCQPVLDALAGIPAADDPRFDRAAAAVAVARGWA